MSFQDYSPNPPDNTTIGDGTFIGPNMPRDNVRPALQQLAADGRDLYDTVLVLGESGVNTDPLLRADLASGAPSKGATLVGTSDGVTVQDKVEHIYLPDQTANLHTMAINNVALRGTLASTMNNTLVIGPGCAPLLTGVSTNANPNTGYGMTIVGTNIAPSAVNPHDCVFMGYETAQHWSDGWNCIAIGAKAGYNATDPQNGIMIGVTAGFNLTNASSTQFGIYGTNACFNATQIQFSDFLGYQSGYYLGRAQYCVALGVRTLGGANNNANTYIRDDIAIGYRALGGIKDGIENIAVGTDSGVSLQDGGQNTLVGISSGANLVNVSAGSMFGYLAGNVYTGAQSAIFGAEALKVNVSGVRLAGFGYRFGQASTGGDIAGIGWTALPNLTSGSRQAVLGNQAGAGIINNDRGVFLGHFTAAAGDYADVVALGDSATVTKSLQFMFGDASKSFEYVFNGYTKPKQWTVATLPAAATAGAGATAWVSDGANTSAFGAIAVGGGSNRLPVVSDGTNWLTGWGWANFTVKGAIRSSAPDGGIGYMVGAGGLVTQATSKSTAVTLDRCTGEITMNNAALAANTSVSFTLNSNAISAADMIVCTHHSGGTIGAYTINGRATGGGTAEITIRNVSAGSLSEAIVVKFALIRGAQS